MQSIAIGSLAGLGKKAGTGWWHFGEGVRRRRGARKKEWVMAHLLVCLGARKGGRTGLAGDETVRGGGTLIGSGALARAGELHGIKVKLDRGLW